MSASVRIGFSSSLVSIVFLYAMYVDWWYVCGVCDVRASSIYVRVYMNWDGRREAKSCVVSVAMVAADDGFDGNE